MQLLAALAALQPSPVPRCGAPAACAPPGPIYAPFVESALSIFAEAELALQPYPLGEGLRVAEATTGAGARRQPVRLRTHAYSAPKLRQIRLVHIEGGDGLQVLNFCIFPSLEYGLPTFSADLVTLPGGHLVALDCQPNGPVGAAAAYAEGGALAAAFARHRGALPDGGPIPPAAQSFFSPCFLWSRLPRDEAGEAAVRGPVLAAFDDYLRAYLRLAAAAPPLALAAERESVRAAQLAYARYRIEHDPARPMLTRLFGGAYCERLIGEVLFDLPRVLAQGGRGEASEASEAAHGGNEAAVRVEAVV